MQDTALPWERGKLQMFAVEPIHTGIHSSTKEVGSMAFPPQESHRQLEEAGAAGKSAVLLQTGEGWGRGKVNKSF